MNASHADLLQQPSFSQPLAHSITQHKLTYYVCFCLLGVSKPGLLLNCEKLYQQCPITSILDKIDWILCLRLPTCIALCSHVSSITDVQEHVVDGHTRLFLGSLTKPYVAYVDVQEDSNKK